MTAPATNSAEIISLLRAKRGMLCTVESCTGGLLASKITDIPGASEVFWGSWVTYALSAKTCLAEVPSSVLEEFGAVSRSAAIAMAEGGLKSMQKAVLDRIESLWAISTTGIAGPSGGTAENPVGTCWIAIARKGGPTEAWRIQGNPRMNREELKANFAQEALLKLRLLLNKK